MTTKPIIMELILNFLNSEKALYLSSGLIGIASLIVGLVFILFFNHKSFAITMIIIGILEIAVMFPTYIKYQHKIDNNISDYKTNGINFLKTEYKTSKKALNSFFLLKLIYAFLIIILALAMSFLQPKSIFFGMFTALILHFAFAITIDNFGEKYTKKYMTELTELLK